MSKLIVEIAQNAGAARKRHFTIDQFPMRIGRGYHNQIIIDDPYISPQHLEVSYHENEGFMIEDLGSTNGLVLNRKKIERTRCRIYSGDEIKIGKTVLRLYEPQHPVEPALPATEETGYLYSLQSSSLSFSLYLLAAACLCFFTYLTVWPTERDQLPNLLFSVTLLGLIISLLWSTLWGLAGRLIRHRVNFNAHLGLFSSYLLAVMVIYFLGQLISFFTHHELFAHAAGYLLHAIAFGFLLSSALSLATDIPAKRRRRFSAYVVLAIMVGFGAVSFIAQNQFRAKPEFNSTLLPYLTWALPADAPEDYIATLSNTLINPALIENK
jgi:hypothetical protein